MHAFNLCQRGHDATNQLCLSPTRCHIPARLPEFNQLSGNPMPVMSHDKTNTKPFEMTGQCPFGGDRIGGAAGKPPSPSDWYPNRLKVESAIHRFSYNPIFS